MVGEVSLVVLVTEGGRRPLGTERWPGLNIWWLGWLGTSTLNQYGILGKPVEVVGMVWGRAYQPVVPHLLLGTKTSGHVCS